MLNAQTKSRFAVAALDLGPQEQEPPALEPAPICPAAAASKSPAQAAREAAWVEEKRMIARYQAGLPPVPPKPTRKSGGLGRGAENCLGWLVDLCLSGWIKALVIVPLVCLPLAMLGLKPAAWGLAAWLVLLIVPFIALAPLAVLVAARRAGA